MKQDCTVVFAVSIERIVKFVSCKGNFATSALLIFQLLSTDSFRVLQFVGTFILGTESQKALGSFFFIIASLRLAIYTGMGFERLSYTSEPLCSVFQWNPIRWDEWLHLPRRFECDRKFFYFHVGTKKFWVTKLGTEEQNSQHIICQ